MYWMNGWDWVWMTFMMGFWLIVLGAVVYVAVRLGQRPRDPDKGSASRLTGTDRGGVDH